MAPASHQLTILPGISDAISQVNESIRQLASTEGIVFITGEAGTEKAFAAKILHSLSPRAGKPLAKISVSWKLPPDTRERFAALSGGTMIINLLKGLPPDLQFTILELANDGAFTDPVSGEMIEADARVFVLSSVDLATLMTSAPLLPEVTEMLRTRSVEIPPIRRRIEDVPALVRYAATRAQETGRSKARGADAQVLALFRQWTWPGNAEDLLLVTAEAALNARGDLITLDDLPGEFLSHLPPELLEQARDVRLPRTVPAPVPVRAGQEPVTSPPEEEEEAPVYLEIPVPAPHAGVVEDYSDERTGEEEFAGAAPPVADPNEGLSARDAQRLERLIVLAQRLHAQSEILSSQMQGPEAAKAFDSRSLLEEDDVETAMAEALESEIQKSLDAIMRVRRQVTVLNERERNAYLTARDLYRRLLMSGASELAHDAEVMGESQELVEQLRQVEAAVARLEDAFRGAGTQPPVSSMAEDILASEAEAIREAYARAAENSTTVDETTTGEEH